MTPAEHYTEADRLVDYVDGLDGSEGMPHEQAANLLRSAQVHATLATGRPGTGQITQHIHGVEHDLTPGQIARFQKLIELLDPR